MESYVSNLTIVKSVCGTLKELSVAEYQKFQDCIQELYQCENKNILMLYRGMDMEYQLNKLNVSSTSEIFDKLFVLGEKASNFHNDQKKYNNNNNEERDYLLDINDISDNTFRYLYNNLKEQANDIEFEDYFETNNEEIFLETIQVLSSKEKLRVRDYYYSYLHTCGDVVNRFSHYTSTSLEYKNTFDFMESDNKLIFHYILIKPYINFAVYSRNMPFLVNLCKSKNLPVYKARYHHENEISIKGGLLPHFILGIECIENCQRTFVVNPCLFDKSLTVADIVTKGFPINQEFFNDVIKTTQYNRFSTVYDNGEMVQEDIN